MENSFLIILQLLLAHIITDFVIQPTSWVKHKREFKGRSKYLYFHAFLAGFLSFLFLMKLEWWYIGVFISVTHYFTDLWKLQFSKDSLKIFLSDQVLHLFAILVAWLYLTSNFFEVGSFLQQLISSEAAMAVIVGYLLVIFPAGFLVGKATKRWQNEVEDDLRKNSLDAAGRYIGIFERILVLTFILTTNFSAIGFLIAAKSILRFSDKSEIGARKQTEYVLIGTLMSFTITILIGFLVRHVMLQ
ncbi:hypothetical protein GCM10023115_51430 [Pontixanthobacter gangjinensis]|uniref:DUF3307 domain-containing protein n=1 Tax=Christiangramia aestuarii TaxID=1028746 RepID=A0A7K1LPJ4_9FLAO|nr:DUF3307 domain-containing protein [Christiangramia aestuarii]MUP42725.1 DUF3307 domain-containing protein [Christiangramia aestuarii]